ncbi:ATP-binding protein [Clostridiales bacterium FE2011]|nr:ATP-binding protein [Clostridiales bacterium FE2011]
MANMVYLSKLPSNETIAVSAIEITAVPHLSIIDSQLSESKVNEQYKREIMSLLNEVFQLYRNPFETGNTQQYKELALELLWITTPVNNQPYKAAIHIYIVFRALDKDEQTAIKIIQNECSLFKSILSGQKYDWKEIEYSELEQIVSKVDDTAIHAIAKEERLDNLQNQILPYCYSYDRLPSTHEDLGRLVNVLSEYPNSAVSVQLIPTGLNSAEAAEIDRTTQMLEMLHRGIADRGVGNVSFTLAEKSSQVYKYYADNKRAPLFCYNILVFGTELAATNIANRLLGQLSSSNETSANLEIIKLYNDNLNKDQSLSALPWIANEYLINQGRSQYIWSADNVSPSFYRLPNIITSEEAAELFRLPIGSERVSAGLHINEAEKTSKTYGDRIINTGDITLGKLRSSTKSDTIGISLKDLTKHMLVVGTPGSGKTTFSVSLLDRLWKDHNIPFLVIEPAKNEYRALIQSIPDLQVFTPGKNFISPFVFNPFVPPKNVRLETYKSTLKTAFSAAVSMSTPLDKIFEETVNNCYSDFRWLDSYTTDNKGQVFNIHDFIRCFQQTFESIGYTGDARNIGRAGVVRLNSMINLFDNYSTIPVEDLLSKPTVIELAAIENSDEKALVIAILLLSILAYVNSNYVGEGDLKNVILLEEAHVLLDSNQNSSQGEANPSAIAQGLIKRMLAECRSYGVSLIIADQSPRKVSTDVVALTDIKMAFRLVEAIDKQIIADSTGLSDNQLQRLAKLKPGEAFTFFGRLEEPEEIITPDYRLEHNISISLSDESIRKLSTYWNCRKEMLRPYPECNHILCCKNQCCYERRILAREVARRIYTHYCNSQSNDIEIVRQIMIKLSALIKAELNDEEFTPELKACVKVHLWRKLIYGTQIKISPQTVNSSLNKQ